MKKIEDKNQHIDDLIKYHLHDDLPPDVEIKMQERIKNWQSQKSKSRRQIRRLFQGEAARLIFRKEVLAMAAMILVMIGGFLQIRGSSNALSSSLSLIGTSVNMSGQIRSSTNMECKILASKDGRNTFFYLIEWTAPGLTRVQAEPVDRSEQKILWISGDGIYITDQEQNTIQQIDNVAQINDPLFLPIIELISPQELADKLYSDWQLIPGSAQNQQHSGKILAADLEQNTALDIYIGPATFLPTRIVKTLNEPELKNKEINHLDIRFKWNKIVPRQKLQPEFKKG